MRALVTFSTIPPSLFSSLPTTLFHSGPRSQGLPDLPATGSLEEGLRLSRAHQPLPSLLCLGPQQHWQPVKKWP